MTKIQKFMQFADLFLYFTEESSQTKIFEHNLEGLELAAEVLTIEIMDPESSAQKIKSYIS